MQMLWADRGKLLGSGATESTDDADTNCCIALSRLGGVRSTTGALTIWIQLRGSGWVEAREGRFQLRRGEWMVLERDSSPLVQVDARGLCIGVAVGNEALKSLERLADCMLYSGRGRLAPADVRTALQLWRTAAGSGDPEAMRPMLLHMAAVQRELAQRVRLCPGRSRNRKRQVFGRMQRARLFLEGNSDRVVRIGELADLTSFSSWYFSKAFQSLYDESPQALSARLRLERAAGLLRSTSMMIGEVAASSGFDNCCSFARAFRARFGMSATRYREEALRSGGGANPSSMRAPRRLPEAIAAGEHTNTSFS
ncbi:helix-turn-helix domain-containing protein [Luteimonas sp. R10]|uniref:helix-turn-helix domain-containing protein n=1 Tax=Luteimonas sp. R10 TaxID=3108176 RepID=UPI00308625F7|nr:helix-turn-helix transcriptional regulator [Luteimonas sp. R10]